MNIEFLHRGLTEDGLTDKSLQEFQNYYSTKENQSTLYNGLVNDGDFNGSFIDFQNKYFPTQAATTTTTTTEPYVAPTVETKEKSEEDLKIEQDAVNTEFWDKTGRMTGYKREYFSKNKDDKWVYTNPESEKVLIMEDIISSTSGFSKLIMGPMHKMLSELQDEEIRVGTLYAEKKGVVTYEDAEEKRKKEKILKDNYTEVEVPDDAAVDMGFADWEVNGKQYSAIRDDRSSTGWYLFNKKSAKIFDKEVKETREKIKEEKVEKDIAQREEDLLTGKQVISDEEELNLVLGDNVRNKEKLTNLVQSQPSRYRAFVEKYGSIDIKTEKWEEKVDKSTKLDKILGQKYYERYTYTKESIGPLIRITKHKHYSGLGDAVTSDIVTYENKLGEELTEEEIKDFDKFSVMKKLDSDMLAMIDGSLSEDNKKLLYKNPELFLSNDDYRAGDAELEREELEKEADLPKGSLTVWKNWDLS